MLTKEQKKIINHTKGSAVVKAGPGTGKTHVLCCRVKHLKNMGVPPENIVLLTYNKDAADNMKARLAEQFNIDNVRCSTIHSLCYDIVRKYWPQLGFTAEPKMKDNLLKIRRTILIQRVASRYHINQKELKKAVYSVINEDEKISPIKQENGLAKAKAEVLKR